MIYIKKNRINKTKVIIYGIVIFIIISFSFARFLFPTFLPALFTSIAVPFWRAEFSIANGSLSSPAMLLRENQDLKRQLEENQIRMGLIEYLEAENARLRSIFISASSTQNRLVAVLKRPPIAPYDELIIDAGLDQQVSSSSLIYSVGNIPIGQVVEVMKNSSKVILFSSPDHKYEVLVGDENYPGVAIGRGGGQYEVDLPMGLDIKEGDHIFSASINTKPLGKVTYVDDSGSSLPFQKVIFSTPVNIYQLRWVLVETKNNE